ILVFSFFGNAAPFKGGTLVPFPAVLTVSLFTNPSGGIPLSWTQFPSGFGSGFPLYFQYAIKDAAAPVGVAMSNALQVVTPEGPPRTRQWVAAKLWSGNSRFVERGNDPLVDRGPSGGSHAISCARRSSHTRRRCVSVVLLGADAGAGAAAAARAQAREP